MTAMETLLATSFERKFSDVVSYDDITKIKSSLFEQYHMTLLSSIKDFEKFESITEKILGDDGTPIIISPALVKGLDYLLSILDMINYFY